MAYSGKITFSTGTTIIRDEWTYFIRFILDSTYWSVVAALTETGGIDTYTVSDSVTATALGTAYDLSAAGKLSALTATDGTTALVEGTDYTVDYDLGRITFLTSGTIVVAGDVVTVDYTWSRTGYVFYSTGVSGSENINIGFMPFINTDGVHGYLEFKCYQLWQTGMIWDDITVGSKHFYSYNFNGVVALWQGTTSLWFFINQQRIIIVGLIQTNYSSCYVGFANRLLLPHEYTYPYIILASEYATLPYSDVSDTRHYIADSQLKVQLDQNNVWQNLPLALVIPTQVDLTNLVEVHYLSGANRALLPLYIKDYATQLDGVFYAPASISASEDTVTIGTDNYLIIEDVFRHAWNQFIAIKEV